MTIEFNLNVAHMEGAVGGSTLDDLSHLMGLNQLEDDSIVFAIIDDVSADLTPYLDGSPYSIKKGQTYLAKCMSNKNAPLFKAVCFETGYVNFGHIEYDLEWIKINSLE